MTEEELLQAIDEAKQTRSVDLTLSGENLTTLPPTIGELTQLVKLNLKDNKLTTLPPEIGNLTNLKRIYLSNNKLTELPPEIGNLQNLEIIYASNNKLTTIPPEIGQITNLQGLYLGDNNLSSLPPEIKNLSQLKNLDLRKNNLDIPKEVLETVHQPANIIKSYLEHKTTEPEIILELKVILFGSSGVGKTSVVQQLVNSKFNPYHIKTKGLNITDWETKYNDKNLTIHFWDFGGTSQMIPAYHCGFSPDSLYILVTDAIEEIQKIEYFLTQISTVAKNPPTILVINKLDQGFTAVDKTPTLLRNNPNLRTFSEISCKKQQNIDSLKTAITEQLKGIQKLNKTFPDNCLDIKEKIQARETPLLTYEEYQTICTQELITDVTKQKEIANFLGDIGTVIYWKNYLVNPQWFINNLEIIFNEIHLQEETYGVLNPHQLQQILELSNLQESQFLLEVIEDLELGFRTEDTDNLILPYLFNNQEPNTGNWENLNTLQYDYAVYPAYVFPRLIVKMKEYIEGNLYWLNGVIFKLEEDRARVTADPTTRKISITVTHNSHAGKDLLKIICTQLDNINQHEPWLKSKRVRPQSQVRKNPINSPIKPPIMDVPPPPPPPRASEIPSSSTVKAQKTSPTRKPINKWIWFALLFILGLVAVIVLSILL